MEKQACAEFWWGDLLRRSHLEYWATNVRIILVSFVGYLAILYQLQRLFNIE